MYYCQECDQMHHEDISPPEEISGELVCEDCVKDINDE